ncbi:MAG: glycosyltransferase family 2 protein [Bacteroidetes bacterium]|nr:glycosyltransferase family 2 protein [Bacteroidota bacterium]
MKASVLCPTWGHAAYIGTCIESIQNQSWQNWELLILDDGSPDDTQAVVARYLSDSRIRYTRQDNQGGARLADHYNALLNLATGDFVTILEGDDYALPGLLEAHATGFMQGNHGVSFNQVIVDEGKTNWISPLAPATDEQKEEFRNEPVGRALNRLLKECFIPAQGASIRVDVLKKTGGFQSVPGLATADYPTWLKLAQVTRFHFIPEPLAVWRRHENQATKQKVVPLTEIMVPVLIQTLETLPEPLKPVVTLQLSDLKAFWDRRYVEIYYRAGKYKLMVGEWKAGRRYFTESLSRWPALMPATRLLSLAGWVLSWFRINMNLVSGLGHRLGKTRPAGR